MKKSTTIVSVTGNSDYTLGSMYAIERSYQELRDHIPQLECLLISPNKPDNLPDYIRHIQCEPFSYLEYNFFMLYSLHQFIHTDYALTVQDDGWILDGKLWRDEFFEYDFIGAIVPCYVYRPYNGEWNIYARDWWQEHFFPVPADCYEPLNGGVSLRSHRLMRAMVEYDLSVSISLKGSTTTEPIKFQYPEHGFNNEDTILTVCYRPFWEQQGFRFPSRETSLLFAAEEYIPLNLYNKHYDAHINIHQILAHHFAGYARLVSTTEVRTGKWYFANLDKIKTNGHIVRLCSLGYRVVIPAQYNYTHTDLIVEQ